MKAAQDPGHPIGDSESVGHMGDRNADSPFSVRGRSEQARTGMCERRRFRAAVPGPAAVRLQRGTAGLRCARLPPGRSRGRCAAGGRARRRPGSRQVHYSPVPWRATRSPASSADVRGREMLEEFFLDGVLIEPGDGAQPPGYGGSGTAFCFELEGEGFDVRAADQEQRKRPCLAPAAELVQVESVDLAGQAAVSGQEPGKREPLGLGGYRLDRDKGGRGNRSGHAIRTCSLPNRDSC